MLLVISFNDFITIQNGSINKCLPGLQVQPSAHQVNLVVETVTISSSVLHSDQTSGAGFIYESCQFVPFRKALSPSPPLAEMKKILHRFSLSLFIQVALFSTDRKMALRRHWTYWKLKRQMCWSITADVDFTMCKKRLNSCSQIRELFKDDFW